MCYYIYCYWIIISIICYIIYLIWLKSTKHIPNKTSLINTYGQRSKDRTEVLFVRNVDPVRLRPPRRCPLPPSPVAPCSHRLHRLHRPVDEYDGDVHARVGATRERVPGESKDRRTEGTKERRNEGPKDRRAARKKERLEGKGSKSEERKGRKGKGRQGKGRKIGEREERTEKATCVNKQRRTGTHASGAEMDRFSTHSKRYERFHTYIMTRAAERTRTCDPPPPRRVRPGPCPDA